eukprot:scaffold642_cov166-Ochromonas_danica.AAC.17
MPRVEVRVGVHGRRDCLGVVCCHFVAMVVASKLVDNEAKDEIVTENDRHEGFARGHPPYYWPRLSTLNFLDLTVSLYEDLPFVRDDPLWTEIRNFYGLSLVEVSPLKNARCGQPQAGSLRLIPNDFICCERMKAYLLVVVHNGRSLMGLPQPRINPMYRYKSDAGLDFMVKKDRDEIILMLSLLQEIAKRTGEPSPRRNSKLGR